ncbi:hypothetical protein BGZ61DRAFT_491319 [Ilyonectria robusta]|uniref:uncharacterized protein n=1 Tax=Ilyonectria robusta TaxID=1079257 RepID=UPI001E8D0C66|nr:uncharacterized protein BGZ61DRAFT_491319 [Ilyonectria robusta]KAH8733751.1 hypothetical protein BGZ61DRAFT_491319 [Ilyonectria robusta]
MGWDQRRLISVTIEDEEIESAEPAIGYPWKHVDDLAPDFFKIRVSKQEELDRLELLVDLARYPKPPESRKKDLTRAQLICLPKYPHIVLFDRLVVDEIEVWCVGFTTALSPLIAVIYEPILSLGISHQNVAPRNLLISDTTDSLTIFDSNFSVRIGEIGYSEARIDIKGVMFTMYQIITQPSPSEVVLNYSSRLVTHLKVLWSVERRRTLEQGKTVLNWQRPAQASYFQLYQPR